jgi:hypothetical protein
VLYIFIPIYGYIALKVYILIDKVRGVPFSIAIALLFVLQGAKMIKNSKIFRNVPDGPMTKNIRIEFEHLEESLLSQYRMLNLLASVSDSVGYPKKHEAFSALARKMLDLWESITECAEEFDSQFSNKEAKK